MNVKSIKVRTEKVMAITDKPIDYQEVASRQKTFEKNGRKSFDYSLYWTKKKKKKKKKRLKKLEHLLLPQILIILQWLSKPL